MDQIGKWLQYLKSRINSAYGGQKWLYYIFHVKLIEVTFAIHVPYRKRKLPSGSIKHTQVFISIKNMP